VFDDPPRFVAVGDEIVTSDDGRTWTQSTVDLAGSLRAIACGPDRWVAVGSDDLVVSNDQGETWTQGDLGNDLLGRRLRDIGYASDGFVTVSTGGPGSFVYTSLDGVVWSMHSVTDPDDPRLFRDGEVWRVFDRASDYIELITDAQQIVRRIAVDEVLALARVDEITFGFARKDYEPRGLLLEGTEWTTFPLENLPEIRAMDDTARVAVAIDGIYRGSGTPPEITWQLVEPGEAWMDVAGLPSGEWIAVGQEIAFSDDDGVTWTRVLP
jgi:hypothetical protein